MTIARVLFAVPSTVILASLASCGSAPHADASDVADAIDTVAIDIALADTPSADVPAPPDAACTLASTPFCTLGTDVPGASVPPGFCIRRFTGTVPEARTLSFASNGDLFVAAPSNTTAGGAFGGRGQIVVLSDDDHDGNAELHVFADAVADVHGLAVTADAVYFTTQYALWRTPYTAGQRAETPSARVQIATLTGDARWTHGLAVDTSGRVLVSTGVLDERCGDTGVGHIDALIGSTLSVVATGMRNPMYLRCHPSVPICVASELGMDLDMTAHERILVVRAGLNFNYPSCYGVGVPSAGCPASACTSVSPEEVTIPIDDTPFGLDWERGAWPAPYAHALFVAKHGDFFSVPRWENAGLYYVAADATTHVPSGPPQPFAFGFGPSAPMMRRPADVAFAPDGRLFFCDDHGGGVYWIAYAGCAP